MDVCEARDFEGGPVVCLNDVTQSELVRMT